MGARAPRKRGGSKSPAVGSGARPRRPRAGGTRAAKDVPAILQAIARTVARLCDAADAHIYRVEGDQLRSWPPSTGLFPRYGGSARRSRSRHGWRPVVPSSTAARSTCMTNLAARLCAESPGRPGPGHLARRRRYRRAHPGGGGRRALAPRPLPPVPDVQRPRAQTAGLTGGASRRGTSERPRVARISSAEGVYAEHRRPGRFRWRRRDAARPRSTRKVPIGAAPVRMKSALSAGVTSYRRASSEASADRPPPARSAGATSRAARGLGDIDCLGSDRDVRQARTPGALRQLRVGAPHGRSAGAGLGVEPRTLGLVTDHTQRLDAHLLPQLLGGRSRWTTCRRPTGGRVTPEQRRGTPGPSRGIGERTEPSPLAAGGFIREPALPVRSGGLDSATVVSSRYSGTEGPRRIPDRAGPARRPAGLAAWTSSARAWSSRSRWSVARPS